MLRCLSPGHTATSCPRVEQSWRMRGAPGDDVRQPRGASAGQHRIGGGRSRVQVCSCTTAEREPWWKVDAATRRPRLADRVRVWPRLCPTRPGPCGSWPRCGLWGARAIAFGTLVRLLVWRWPCRQLKLVRPGRASSRYVMCSRGEQSHCVAHVTVALLLQLNTTARCVRLQLSTMPRNRVIREPPAPTVRDLRFTDAGLSYRRSDVLQLCTCRVRRWDLPLPAWRFTPTWPSRRDRRNARQVARRGGRQGGGTKGGCNSGDHRG